MTTADRPKRSGQIGKALGYALIAAAVWVGWEILKIPVVERAPPAIALRLAPGSPEVLRRAAEGEFLAEDWQDAAYFANRSLSGAPFNARALRVRGLVAARTDHGQTADQLLTLAGNWSLRDDPAHAWLVEHRLRQGSYSSAFAHADTLVRRRRDLYDQVFSLFTTAALQDPRALSSLVRLVSLNPPWRLSYLGALQKQPGGDLLLLRLGVALQRTSHPLTDEELSRVYRGWVSTHRYAALRTLRTHLGRPSLTPQIQNGNFSQTIEKQLQPFGWTVGAAEGLAAEITEDDLQPGNQALWVNYSGYGEAHVTQQLLVLDHGRHVFAARYRQENESSTSFEWTLRCMEDGALLMRLRLPVAASADIRKWMSVSATVDVPKGGCTTQSLVLSPRASDRRSLVTIWFDDISLNASNAANSSKV